jgi:hypothetical protein
LQRLNVHAGARKQRARRAILLRDERGQHMNRFDVLIVMADGQTLRIRQCFLEFSGEFVDSHQETSNFDYHQNEAFYAGFKRFFAADNNYLTFDARKIAGRF